jgi:hypothetical protein
MMTWLCAAALAADAWWVGQWGLDPSRSDDGAKAVEDAFVAPVAPPPGAGSPTGMSPDQGQSDSEDQRQKALSDAMGLLGRSGRCVLAPVGEDALSIDFGDGATTVALGNHWTKVQPASGDRYRIRAWLRPDVLIVERRYKTNTLTESWLPPTDPESRDRAVVVQLQGPSLTNGVEFRRVYRRLD